ncbi:polyketide synthase-nonribosomal peptide synthetase-1 [Coleophoma cylindrospora]|uniref:Polyketide synthase-nonribosomal peptide synthetase-1 n=1 Tax=Coleophoma cylindrospora TaxID=1849047 RepID=A0A3D8S2H3_9HELO|nr:polyketide synthase-nonribosomal peptide synthetase-1 [Coleophoma cylindrospora]
MAPHAESLRADMSPWSESEPSTPPHGRINQEDIAIVGMACKLPGGVDSPSQLWNLLVEAQSGQASFPSPRSSSISYIDDRPGSMHMKGGYFLRDADVRSFENGFFGINNMEAQYMDPQQRKLLETVYEAFESGGVRLEDVSGANVGCYVGNFTMDFQQMQLRDSEYLHRYSATGLGTTILGNRVSHVFNLQGPSFVIDTACSSSLYCLHAACVALENFECDSAVVAGANLIQSPEQHFATMKAGVLSPTSTCHTFDASADGYGRADGIGALYLKRLQDAIRDGDPIRSVIRGSAINANGRTPGITLPDKFGQEKVIRKAHVKAGLLVQDTPYVECHGTGTPVGDPIEAEAVSLALDGPSRSQPILIGSIKSNLGHSEAASGISSVIKATLMLENAMIPATVGVRKLNPKIRAKEWNVDVVTELRPFASLGHRRVGVNSFGYGGANAHVVIENAPTKLTFHDDTDDPTHQRSKYLLPFSAFTEASLKARVADLAAWPGLESTQLPDLAATLGQRRTHFKQRGFLVSSKDELHRNLTEQTLRLGRGQTAPPNYAFVFTGQGAQWPQMGQELIDEFPIFAAAISEMDSVLAALAHPPAWTIAGALREPKETSQVGAVTHSQPLCTAVQIGLVKLLSSWGIHPRAVVGHSSGEIAAAFASGKITIAEAIVAAYYRGYVVGGQTYMKGMMMATGLSAASASIEIVAAGLEDKLVVACINSPENVTISGDEDAIQALQERLHSQKLFARTLRTDGNAYHSHHMKAHGDKYESLVTNATPKLGASSSLASGATMFSSVTGHAHEGPFDAAYWRSNLEKPVRFVDALSELAKDGKYTLIELGPHSALELPIKQTQIHLKLEEDALFYFAALNRGKDAVDTVLSLAGSLWLAGHELTWNKVNDPGFGKAWAPSVIANLPPYHWAYDGVLWNESRLSLEFRNRKYGRHELLGSMVPGGSETDLNWRNVVCLDDLPWLSDHRLNDTVVMPGGAFLAMAMEAVSQATGTSLSPGTGLEMRNVHIITALTISTAANSSTELFTNLRKSPITKVSSSETWWDFKISTYREGIPVIHATGVIAIQEPASTEAIEPRIQLSEAQLEPSAKRIWYQRFEKGGLNYGPLFQSLDKIWVPRSKEEKVVLSKLVRLEQKSAADGAMQASYPFHPITLDAMVQAGIVATAAGQTRKMQGFVPTKFSSASFRVPPPQDNYGIPQIEDGPRWQIQATARTSGINSAIFEAELLTPGQSPVAVMQESRLHSYTALTNQDASGLARHPALRVVWKPDIYGPELLRERDLTKYLDHFFAEAHSPVGKDEGLIKLGAAINLVSHRNPRVSILELGAVSHDYGKAVLEMLDAGSDYKRLSSYTTGSWDKEMGGVFAQSWDLAAAEINSKAAPQPLKEQKFDVVLMTDRVFARKNLMGSQLDWIQSLLSTDGIVLALFPPESQPALPSTLDVTISALDDGSGAVLLASSNLSRPKISGITDKAVIIVQHTKTALGASLQQAITNAGTAAQCILYADITEATSLKGATVISLLEAESPLLAGITDNEMHRLKLLTDQVKNLLWVTAGDLLSGRTPEMGLAAGLSRALMLEQPSLRFMVYDMDKSTDVDRTAHNLVQVLTFSQTAGSDLEYVEHDSIVHIARFVPDTKINAMFRLAQGTNETVDTTIGEMSGQPIQLAIAHPGQFDSIHFRAIELPSEGLAEDEIKISVKAVGLNAKDLYVLAGKVDTPEATCALEFAGVVDEVGCAIHDLVKGDRVVVMAPNHFRSVEIVPRWAAKKLRDDESFTTMSTIPLVCATALYALQHRANLGPGESVLIHSGAGGVGIAAIQVAKAMGAEVFTTVSTDEKKKYLVEKLGVKEDHVFSSRDGRFADEVLKATDGQGVDVVLNSLTGDLLRTSWRCVGPFGRFVEIGKRDLLDSGRLDMDPFLRNSSFSAFDLSAIYLEGKTRGRMGLRAQALWKKLLDEVVYLLRAGTLKSFAALGANQVVDVSEMASALRLFSSRNRIGKIAVSVDNPSSPIRVQPLRYNTRLSADKSYIMVGCLGGLGRSLSRWMLGRGARKFVFVGRSGTDRPSARRIVEDLTAAGAECQVVRGDVVSATDVQKAVDAVDGKIGGVVQAAMGLNEALFTTMPNKYWHTGIDPKVIGTWNIHNAIQADGKDSELDFFLMTSSVSGSVGTATESNYCAGNHFLDMFARYRRAQGRPAMAIGFGMISEIGYLHDNPEIEALLLRKGIQAINEDEFLQITDLALSQPLDVPHVWDTAAAGHVLTGLEPFGFMELRRQGFDVTNLTFNDPRALVLAAVVDSTADDALKQQAQNGDLPADVASAIDEGATLEDAVLRHVAARFGNLVLTPVDKVPPQKPLTEFGMDSMIAAEFRTWFFQAFRFDVPFLELLSKTVTVASLAALVAADIEARR